MNYTRLLVNSGMILFEHTKRQRKETEKKKELQIHILSAFFPGIENTTIF
jgi:hypothetical protein